jgi:hypothetical protein
MSEQPVKFAIYENDTPGTFHHPRKLIGYSWKDPKDGSIICEDVKTGKITKINLP